MPKGIKGSAIRHVEVETIPLYRWVTAVLDQEETGLSFSAERMADDLETQPHYVEQCVLFLRKHHLLTATHRVAARGRWLLGVPTLCYVAVDLDPFEPNASAAQAIAIATNVAASLGWPLVPLMPTPVTLAAAARGDEQGQDALVAFAQRADLVLVASRDPLVEERMDVIAAQRADVMTVVADGEDPAAMLLERIRTDRLSHAMIWRGALQS